MESSIQGDERSSTDSAEGEDEVRYNKLPYLLQAYAELLYKYNTLANDVEFMAKRLDKEPGNQTVVSIWLYKVKKAREAIDKVEKLLV